MSQTTIPATSADLRNLLVAMRDGEQAARPRLVRLLERTGEAVLAVGVRCESGRLGLDVTARSLAKTTHNLGLLAEQDYLAVVG